MAMRPQDPSKRREHRRLNGGGLSPAPTPLNVFLRMQNLQATLNLQERTLNQFTAPLQYPRAMPESITHTKLLHDKIDAFVQLKEEICCRKHEEKWEGLLQAAEAEAAKNLREKDAAMKQIASRCIGLHDELARTSAELATWKSLAASEQSDGARLRSLIVGLANAPTPPPESCGSCSGGRAAGDGVEDTESVGQIGSQPTLLGSCVVCRRRKATVVLLPCRCLSLCSDCQAHDGGQSCPSCGGGVKVRMDVVICCAKLG